MRFGHVQEGGRRLGIADGSGTTSDMPSYDTHASFFEALRDELGHRYRAPAGALFTVAMVPVDPQGMMFATGKIVFHDQVVPARGALAYPAMTLAEEWMNGTDSAIECLRLLLDGHASIAGQQVRGRFGGTYDDRNVQQYQRNTPWAERLFKTAWHHEGPRPSLNNEPLLAFGQPPFQTARTAVLEWVYGRIPEPGSDAPHMNELLTIVPDTRARIGIIAFSRDTSLRGEIVAVLTGALIALALSHRSR